MFWSKFLIHFNIKRRIRSACMPNKKQMFTLKSSTLLTVHLIMGHFGDCEWLSLLPSSPFFLTISYTHSLSVSFLNNLLYFSFFFYFFSFSLFSLSLYLSVSLSLSLPFSVCIFLALYLSHLSLFHTTLSLYLYSHSSQEENLELQKMIESKTVKRLACTNNLFGM